MDQFPRLPPPQSRGRFQFSIRTLFAATTLAAFLVWVFTPVGLLIVASLLLQLMLLAGVAAVVSNLQRVVAGSVAFAVFVLVVCVTIGISQRSHSFKSSVRRLAEAAKVDIEIDAVLIWMFFLGVSVILGAVLGWGMAAAQED